MESVKPPSADDEASAAITCRTPRRTWAGHGTGASCDLCRQTVTSEQIEYEVELDESRQSIRMHFACYQRWVTSS